MNGCPFGFPRGRRLGCLSADASSCHASRRKTGNSGSPLLFGEGRLSCVHGQGRLPWVSYREIPVWNSGIPELRCPGVLVGPSGVASDAWKRGMQEGARAGETADFWLCRARLTHIGAPPSYALGSFGPLRSRRLKLWAKFGPWGGGPLATHLYDRGSGSPSSGWDWKAGALNMGALPPLSSVPDCVVTDAPLIRKEDHPSHSAPAPPPYAKRANGQRMCSPFRSPYRRFRRPRRLRALHRGGPSRMIPRRIIRPKVSIPAWDIGTPQRQDIG